MTEKQKQKLQQLFLFIKEHGYECSIEKIAEGIHVTPKTIFNRYQNKEKMEEVIQKYWREQFWERFQQKQEQCNNAIETLVLLAFDIDRCAHVEKTFFEREFGFPQILENGCSPLFSEKIRNIISNGIDKGLFNESLLKKNYIDYLLYTICTLFIGRQYKPELLQYIFLPLLTEYGLVIFNEINLDLFVS